MVGLLWCCARSGSLTTSTRSTSSPGGRPANLTQTVPIYAYNVGWGLKQLGRSSAVTVLLLIFLLIVCMFYFKILDKWEKEGA